MSEPVLLTMGEAAERLGTTHRFVRRLVSERRIAYLKLGRHVRISTTDLDDFVRQARIEPRPQSQRLSASRHTDLTSAELSAR